MKICTGVEISRGKSANSFASQFESFFARAMRSNIIELIRTKLDFKFQVPVGLSTSVLPSV